MKTSKRALSVLLSVLMIALTLSCPALCAPGAAPTSGEVVHVTVTTQGDGTAYGGGTFTKGTLVTVQASPNLLSVFDGWYQDGVMVSTNQKYSFFLLQRM